VSTTAVVSAAAASAAAAASTAARESAVATAARESAVAVSSVLPPQEAVAIKPAIAKIANTFFICYGFLNYRTNVLGLILIVQAANKIFYLFL
jgi:hypothetical protein